MKQLKGAGSRSSVSHWQCVSCEAGLDMTIGIGGHAGPGPGNFIDLFFCSWQDQVEAGMARDCINTIKHEQQPPTQGCKQRSLILPWILLLFSLKSMSAFVLQYNKHICATKKQKRKNELQLLYLHPFPHFIHTSIHPIE